MFFRVQVVAVSMRIAILCVLALALPGCIGDCSGTTATWDDAAAPAFLRDQLGSPEVFPYQNNMGFGRYRVDDAVLLQVYAPENPYHARLEPGYFTYGAHADEDPETVRSVVWPFMRDAYAGDLQEADAALDASLAKFVAESADLSADDRPVYMLGGGVEVAGEWDLEKLWGDRDPALEGEHAHAFATSPGNWTFRYRLAEWRFDVDDLGVSYDILGGAEARHPANVEAEHVEAEVSAWFEARGHQSAFDEMQVSQLRC